MMGARNVAGALAMYPDLGHRAMRLLVGMALTALDRPTDAQPAAQRYFNGRDHQAEILGYRLPARPDETDEARRVRANAYEQVRRALAELAEAGAVERVTQANGKWRSEYLLRVTTGPVDNDPAQAHLLGAPWPT